ncbi:uncharacterized protein CLUP02_02426 [Colletotrichum lupini]|uniref:Uncharacterized protein n=1 Tax=Colletotrichum lupini TaxID=145971 RepID=A0A9Q8SHA4_9PEZI|nr:uncharacterized protein CLUP02_02426 [Colletotrichum lupini]UQC76960.1 hypothetical protein CLUP02_02426 [Colletotrichum lupini]
MASNWVLPGLIGIHVWFAAYGINAMVVVRLPQASPAARGWRTATGPWTDQSRKAERHARFGKTTLHGEDYNSAIWHQHNDNGRILLRPGVSRLSLLTSKIIQRGIAKLASPDA